MLTYELRIDVCFYGQSTGVPKEIKVDEHRVAMTPLGAKVLVQQGFKVLIEHGAGEGSGFTDAAYKAAGAVIVDSHEKVGPSAVCVALQSMQ